jgi:hypothetical protein
VNEKGPLQIIAELLPFSGDDGMPNRLDIAHDILIALNQAGYVIHARDVRVLQK